MKCVICKKHGHFVLRILVFILCYFFDFFRNYCQKLSNILIYRNGTRLISLIISSFSLKAYHLQEKEQNERLRGRKRITRKLVWQLFNWNSSRTTYFQSKKEKHIWSTFTWRITPQNFIRFFENSLQKWEKILDYSLVIW